MPERIAVFLDFQNVHLTGHAQFDSGPLHRCVPDPARLADLIAGMRNRPSEAVAVRVYRGQPHPQHDPLQAATNDAQASQWSRDQRVQVIRRQLRYREGLPPQEKGIDVALAVDLVHLAFRKQYDALVVFSGDTDLLPALELVVSLGLGHVEVACWSGAKPLRFAGGNWPWCHFLGADDWKAVTENWDSRPASARPRPGDAQ
jgi:uncharacterized LabA/DUF88 family protein